MLNSQGLALHNLVAMTVDDIDKFEKVQGQLESLLSEIAVLAKKSPNDGVNKFKLNFINKVLKEANNILEKKYIPLDSFSQFNEDDLPSNSDVTFILSQYLSCFEKLRADNIKEDRITAGHRSRMGWVWIIDDEDAVLETAPPKKLK